MVNSVDAPLSIYFSYRVCCANGTRGYDGTFKNLYSNVLSYFILLALRILSVYVYYRMLTERSISLLHFFDKKHYVMVTKFLLSKLGYDYVRVYI